MVRPRNAASSAIVISRLYGQQLTPTFRDMSARRVPRAVTGRTPADGQAAPPDRLRIPLRWQGTPDGRSLGKPIQVMRNLLAGHPEGFSREELEQAVQAEMGDRFPTAPGSFSEILYRLRKQDEVEEVEGKLVPKRLTRTTRSRHG